MSVKSLARGGYRRPLPPFGTVEHIDGTGAGGTSITVSSMAADEFSLVVAGASSKSYIYSIGYSEHDLQCTTLGIWHNGTGWQSIHLAMVRPYPSTAKTHDTAVQFAQGSGDNEGWCRARFRAKAGFRGRLVAARGKDSGAQYVNLTVTPFANPMKQPGGLCVVAAFKDFTAYPTSVSGTGWGLGGNGELQIIAYYPLSTQRIETPGNVTLNSASGSHHWATITAYLR